MKIAKYSVDRRSSTAQRTIGLRGLLACRLRHNAKKTARIANVHAVGVPVTLRRAAVACFGIVFVALGVWPSGVIYGATPKHLTDGWYPGDSAHYLSGTIDALPHKPRVVPYYTSWGKLFAGTAFNPSFVHAAASDGVVTFIELEPWDYTQNPPAQDWLVNIANGSSDAQLRKFGAQIAATGSPVWITFAHEMNFGSWYPWNLHGSERAAPSTWIKAWNRVTAEVDAGAGAKRSLISWTWVPTVATQKELATIPAYWSSNHVTVQNVNIMGEDAYLCHGQSTGTCGQTYTSWIAPNMKVIRGLNSRLPLVLTETGIGGAIGTRAPQITTMVRAIRADPANVTGVLWFDQGQFKMTSAEESAWASVLTNG